MGGFLFASLALAIIGIFFLPIFIRAEFYFDLQSNKIGCRISLYGIAKVLGGYISPCAGGFAFHVSNKKAIFVPFQEWAKGQKSFAEKHGIRLRTVKAVVDADVDMLFPIFTIQELTKGVLLFFKNTPTLKTDVRFTNSENFRLFLRADFSTSLMK